jgi:hypothetical protein
LVYAEEVDNEILGCVSELLFLEIMSLVES